MLHVQVPVAVPDLSLPDSPVEEFLPCSVKAIGPLLQGVELLFRKTDSPVLPDLREVFIRVDPEAAGFPEPVDFRGPQGLSMKGRQPSGQPRQVVFGAALGF